MNKHNPQTYEQLIKEYQENIQRNVIGKIIPEHDETGHKYRFVDSGKLVKSVTTKLIVDRPHLIPWAVKVAFEYMEDKWSMVTPENRQQYIKNSQQAPVTVRDDAGDTGHVSHQIIEDYSNDWIKNGISTNILDYVPSKHATNIPVLASIRSAERAFKDFRCIPIASEILVGDEEVAAGTLDMLVMNEDGDLELWDWKTSNTVQDTYAFQVSAYKKFFEKMTGLTIARVRIIHLSKEYAYPEMYFVPDVDKAYKAFTLLSELYDIINDGTKTLQKDTNKIILNIK